MKKTMFIHENEFENVICDTAAIYLDFNVWNKISAWFNHTRHAYINVQKWKCFCATT